MTTDSDLEQKIDEHRQQALEMRPEMPIRVVVDELPNNPRTGKPYEAETVFKWSVPDESDA